jgi:hypothetical protein
VPVSPGRHPTPLRGRAGEVRRFSAWRGRPTSERAGWSAAASVLRPASGRPCADCSRHMRLPC